jgi:hypothetical protein
MTGAEGGYIVRTTQKTAMCERTTTIKVLIATVKISCRSIFICLRSFVVRKQTAMQSNPLHYTKDAVYNALKGKLDLNNLVGSTIQIAKEIEQIEKLKGKEKLELLQSILRISIHDSEKSLEEKEALYFTVDRVVPVIIEAAILASKSPIIKQVQAVCCGCWTKK